MKVWKIILIVGLGLLTQGQAVFSVNRGLGSPGGWGVPTTGTGGVTSFIIMEDGSSRILQEDGVGRFIVEP